MTLDHATQTFSHDSTRILGNRGGNMDSPNYQTTPTPHAAQGPQRGIKFGCAIAIGGTVFFAALICFALWQGMKRSELIDEFTSPEPTVLAIARLDATESERVESELAAFITALREGRDYVWKLDAAELNHLLAISSPEDFGELKGQLRVTDIRDDRVLAEIAFPINRLPWEKGERFLNGKIEILPEIVKNNPILKVTSLRVPGKEVPDWFDEHFSIYNLVERFSLNPDTYDLTRQISELKIEHNELVVKAAPFKVER